MWVEWAINGPTVDTHGAAWCLEDRPPEYSGTPLSKQWSEEQTPIDWDGSVFPSWYSDGPSPQLPAPIPSPTPRNKILGIVWRKIGHPIGGVGWWWTMQGGTFLIIKRRMLPKHHTNAPESHELSLCLFLETSFLCLGENGLSVLGYRWLERVPLAHSFNRHSWSAWAMLEGNRTGSFMKQSSYV